MTRKLEGIAPERVFYYFEEISKIPRGSGNTDKISEYLAEFAQEKKLRFEKDNLGNVIIFKDASKGYEDREPIMLQGHVDMVIVKNAECLRDLEKEGLDIAVSGDNIYAKGSSLGADDGIAVAYCMALLEDNNIAHPPLEAIFTVDEETGLDGAKNIDLSSCKGRRMINLDSDDEGIFWVGCAGGLKIKVNQPLVMIQKKGIKAEITIKGLTGGHSGVDIHMGKGNANQLLGRLLWKVSREIGLNLVHMEGGAADNAIPASSAAEIVVDSQSELVRLTEICNQMQQQLKSEYALKDKDVEILCKAASQQGEDKTVFTCSDGESGSKAAALLYSFPGGVQSMSAAIPELVETSLNLGFMIMKDNSLQFDFAVRSSVESAKEALEDRLKAITALAGATMESNSSYPGWEYQEVSPLRETMSEVYKRMYGEAPVNKAIHAGLECGYFVSKLPGLDCVSMGPNMKDIHTDKERLSISSTKRVWEFLLELLAQL